MKPFILDLLNFYFTDKIEMISRFKKLIYKYV